MGSYRASQNSGLYSNHHRSQYSSQYFSQGPDSVEFPLTSKPGVDNQVERKISNKSCVCGSRVEKILILECVGAYMRCEYVPSSKQLPYRCDFVQQEEEPW